MTSALTPTELGFAPLPDHTQLPDSDGTFVKNYQEHPQSIIITDSILPHLQQRYPDGQYSIGQDSGIYWRIAQPPEPPERGAEAPDWFLVLNVSPTLNGQLRRSYVLWQEHIAPLIVIEFVSGDGSQERDRTPFKGKFWVYEQAIRPAFYAIYEVQRPSIEVFHLVENRFEPISANSRGHYPIAPLGVELGLWQGEYLEATLPWLRWWDLEGNLLLMGEERAEIESQRAEAERQRAEAESQRAEAESQRAERLAERLRALGIDPDAIDEEQSRQ